MDPAFQWVITAAVVLACIALLLQAGYTIGMYRAAKRMEAKVVPLADRTEPILATARQMLDETRPKLAEFSSDAVEIARRAREQAIKLSALVDETAVRARFRIAQIDERVDQTVEHVEEVGGAVKGAVMRPLREVNAIMAGVRAAVLTYISGRRSSVDTATQDEEMFI